MSDAQKSQFQKRIKLKKIMIVRMTQEERKRYTQARATAAAAAKAKAKAKAVAAVIAVAASEASAGQSRLSHFVQLARIDRWTVADAFELFATAADDNGVLDMVSFERCFERILAAHYENLASFYALMS